MDQGQIAADQQPDSDLEIDPAAAMRDQRVELIYTQAPAALAAALFIAMLISFGLWGVADHFYLLVWSGAQLVQTVMRASLVYLYRQTPADERRRAYWLQLFFAGALTSGVIWGCLGLLFSLSWPVEYQTLAIMGVAGVLAGAISSYAVMLPVYTAFMLPAILIPALAMLMPGDALNSNLGLMFIVFAGALLLIARNYNRSVLKTLQLRRENRTLLRDMTAANLAMESEVAMRRRVEKELLREQQLFTEGPVTVFRWSVADGWPIEYVSATVSQFGYSAGELMQENSPYSGIVHPDDLQRLQQAEFVKGNNGAPSRAIDYRVVRPDGGVRWVYDYTVPVQDEGGDPAYYTGYILDITDRKQMEFELQESNERVQLTLHSIADAVITTDVNGQVEYLNPRAEEMVGWESSIARGLSIARIFSLFDDHSRQSIEDPIRQCLGTGECVQTCEDRTLRRNDGRQYNMQYSASPIRVDGGSVLGVILVFHDVTETRVMEREISYRATHDTLTGLINRAEFEAQLGFAMESARKTRESHVLWSIDIDKLKVVNETCSYEAGDELICKVADTIRSCLRESDILARLGGDEFGVLLKNCTLEGAAELASNMLAVFHSLRFSSSGQTFEVRVSIGIAQVHSEVESAYQVMGEADLACYASKDMGGNRYHIYQTSDKHLVQRHDEMRWVSRLTQAIESDRLVLYYQDIVPVIPDADAGHHFEVLVRMLDDQGGVIPPDRFLPAAERYGLAVSLDRWVISHSFMWYDRYTSSTTLSQPLRMSLNLSGASITDDKFLKFIIGSIRYHNIQPEAICFEITETAAIANLDAAIEFMQELKKLGCRFALDDFGSGLSSFAYLKALPVDYLKIDGGFVKHMDTDALDCAMVRSIHQVGSVIGVKTIAEFVENDQILRKLAEIGVDYAQGYGIAKPAPLEEMASASRQYA